MAMAYPETLPAPLLEGHAISAGQDTIRTDMETGAARQRRRSFSSPDRVNLAWVFNSTQFAVFRAWYDGEINGGGAWFTLPIDDGVLGYATPRDVRFVESFEASKLGSQMWRISVKAEIRRQRLSAFDHLNLLGLPSLDLDFAGTKSLSPVITSARQPTPSITFTRASTATYVDADGLIKTAAINAPRFDHDPVSLACKGLLIEESRTNLLTKSISVDTNDGWTKGTNLTRVGSAAAPDGTNTATTYTTSSGGFAFASKTVALATNTTYTLSVYARLRSGSVPSIGSLLIVDYDSDNNAGTLERVTRGWSGLSSSWARFSLTFTNVAGLASTSVYICTDFANGAQIDVWGAQLEVGSFPTSYIPTTTAAVTRAADSAVMTGANFSSWYRSDELTVFVDRISPAYSAVEEKDLVILHDGTGNNFFSLRVVGGGTQSLDATVRASWAMQVDSNNPACAANLVHKHAAALKANDFADSINGAAVFSDSSVTVPALNQMTIGVSGAGWFRKIRAYPKRLSNAQLQALTV